MLESIHNYPRRSRWALELISLLLVLLTALITARTLLQLVWATFTLDRSLFANVPGLPMIVGLVGIADARQIGMIDLQRALIWFALALLLTILLRNALPTIRTSTQGLLVEFFGGWLPISWEELRAVRVTQDATGKRFVLLIETQRSRLTDWHRLYTLLYRLGWRRSFLVSSSISNFEGLVREILSESDRIARVLEGVRPVQLDERHPSLLFGLVMNPAGFFGRRSPADDRAAGITPQSTYGPVIRGSYPARIGTLLGAISSAIAALAATGFVLTLVRLAALQFPPVARLVQGQGWAIYEAAGGAGLGRLWLLVAAILLLALGLLGASGLRALLPEIETRPEGLAVRHGRGWRLVPWQRVLAITDTEISEQNHVLLLQAEGGLSWPHRLSSLLYEGSWKPGVLITSAISNFEPLMQRVVLEVTRAQGQRPTPRPEPLLRTQAYSKLLQLTLRPGQAIDRLVEEAREEDPPPPVTLGRVLTAARPMVALSLLPALLLIVELTLRQAQIPSLRLLSVALMLWLISFLEWPVVSLVAQVFDEGAQSSSEGSRGLYLYPTVQLPRVVALLASLLLLIAAAQVPFFGFLPLLLWLVAIGWSFLLTAGLWESLYDWRGTQLLIGGAAPVIYQLLVLLAYLIVRA
jgi:hypothetical protein